MRTILVAIFGTIFMAMIGVTFWASSQEAVWSAGRLFGEPWFVATFFDAYCGFITFYVWVAYRERRLVSRVGWFVAIMTLGNIAMAVYMLIRLARLRPGQSWETLLLRPSE